MVDAPNDLDSFFASQKKKTKKKGKTTAQQQAADKKDDESATTSVATKDEVKQEDKKDAEKDLTDKTTASAAAAKNAPGFDDSDEEAEGNIVLKDELKSKFKDKKETQSSKKHSEKQTDDGKGWNLGGNLGKDAPEDPKPSAASMGPKKAGVDGINFGMRAPTFSRSNNKVVNKMEFPELGDIGSKNQDKPVFKKDMGYQDVGGSSAAAPRSEKPKPQEAPKMPVFTGRVKLDSGTTAADIQNSKQNYDMSFLKNSAATAKPRGEGEGRGERGGRGRGGQGRGGFGGGADEDDDFEVVTDKKRQPKRREFGGPDSDLAFGEKPTYSRGGRGGKK